MRREKRLTKREMKAIRRRTAPAAVPTTRGVHEGHIHCIACGKHLRADMFGAPDGASYTPCDHGTDFPHCNACADDAKRLIVEHDTSGSPIQSAPAWH